MFRFKGGRALAQRRRTRRRSDRAQRVAPGAVGSTPSRRRSPPTATRPVPGRFLVIGGVLLLAIVVGVVVNYWVSVKRPGDQPILQVNNRVFSWSDYVRLLRSQKQGAEALGTSFNRGVAPYQLMQSIAENELIRQAAAREGLSTTKEAIRKEMMSRLLPTPSEGADPRQLDREFDVKLHNYLAAIQLSSSEYKEIVRIDLLREQLRQKLGEGIRRVQPQGYLHLIKVPTEKPQAADDVKKRLATGEEFASVARKLSEHQSQDDGGEVGWAPRVVFKELDDLLFGLAEGATSEPLTTGDGVYLVRLLERQGEKARLQAILVKDLAAARDMDSRLKAGASFADLSAQFSVDPALRAARGDLGLVGVGDRGDAFDRLIRGLELDKVEQVDTADGTYFLKVTGRTEAGEVSEANLEILKTRALEVWLRREWDANSVNYCPRRPDDCFSNTDVDRALAQIENVSLTKTEKAVTATAQAAAQGQSQPR